RRRPYGSSALQGQAHEHREHQRAVLHRSHIPYLLRRMRCRPVYRWAMKHLAALLMGLGVIAFLLGFVLLMGIPVFAYSVIGIMFLILAYVIGRSILEIWPR